MLSSARRLLVAVTLTVAAVSASTARAERLKVDVVQTVVENRLVENLAKIERFINEAKEHGCQMVVFPENALYWADSPIDNATGKSLTKTPEESILGTYEQH